MRGSKNPSELSPDSRERREQFSSAEKNTRIETATANSAPSLARYDPIGELGVHGSWLRVA